MFVLKEEEVDGLGPWLWPEKDQQTWDIIKMDWNGSHKKKWLDLCERRVCAVQAGGNCGLYPRLLSQHFQVVYTFEPDPINFYCLVHNCPGENVVKMQCALGFSRQPIQVLRVAEQNCGMHRVQEADTGAIPQIQIDDLNLPYCDFIQLDVELHEFAVIQGAVKTIERHKPVISVENSNPEIEYTLKQFGYRERTQSMMDTIFTIA